MHPIIDAKIIMTSEKGFLTLNKGLDNYQLSWHYNNLEIIYRVNARKSEGIFEYTRKRSDYENKFRVLEHSN